MSTVAAVHLSTGHRFSKATQDSITLQTGLGVEGDAPAEFRKRDRV